MKKIILLAAALSVSISANAEMVAGADFDQGFESPSYGEPEYSQDNYSAVGDNIPGHLDSTYSQDNAAYDQARVNDAQNVRAANGMAGVVRGGGRR